MSQEQVLDGHVHEIETALREIVTSSLGFSGNEALAIRREGNRKLRELLAEQDRAMAFMAGEKIEPKTHFGEGVLIGVLGGGEPEPEQ